ncbi:MAG: hypothetical protein ACLFU7_14925 [Armatimonadota bacterium]
MMGAVRCFVVVVVAVMICDAAWAGTLVVTAHAAMTPVAGANVEVQPCGITGRTNADGKWKGAVPAGRQQVIVWATVRGALKGGIADFTMLAGNHDLSVPMVDAVWIYDYWPMAVGNAWQYEYRHSGADGAYRATWRERIDRTEAYDGDTAMVVAASKDGVPEWEELRACNRNGFAMYTQQHGSDTIKFDPPIKFGPLLPLGYEWVRRTTARHSDGSPDTPVLMRAKFSRLHDVRVPRGLFPDCAQIDVRFELGPDGNDLTVWMAEDVGVVREIEKNRERTNTKLLEEYSVRGVLPLRPIRPVRPLTPTFP